MQNIFSPSFLFFSLLLSLPQQLQRNTNNESAVGKATGTLNEDPDFKLAKPEWSPPQLISFALLSSESGEMTHREIRDSIK